MSKISPLLILDFDGTLARFQLPTEIIRSKIEEQAKRFNLNYSFRPLMSTYQVEHEKLKNLDEQKAKEFNEMFWGTINQSEILCAETIQTMPGLYDFLQITKELPKVLFTNNSVEAVRKALKNLHISPDTFLTIKARDRNESMKPSVERVERLIEYAKAQVKFSHVFLLGDHPFDMQSVPISRCAHGIDIFTFGMSKGPEHRRTLEESGADFIVRSLDEFTPYCFGEQVDHPLSIVFLAHNEEASLKAAIGEARAFSRLYSPNMKSIVVDDGSTDNTEEVLESLAGDDLQIIQHEQRMGMGVSMLDGYCAAQTKYVVHLPADRQVRPQHLMSLLPSISSYKVPLTTYETPPSGSKRSFMSWAFRMFVKWVGNMHVNFAGTYIVPAEKVRGLEPKLRKTKSFVLSFLLLRFMKDIGMEFEYFTIRPFERSYGESKEANTRSIWHVLREIYEARKIL